MKKTKKKEEKDKRKERQRRGEEVEEDASTFIRVDGVEEDLENLGHELPRFRLSEAIN